MIVNVLTELALRPISGFGKTSAVSEQFWSVGDVVRKLRGDRTQAWLAKKAGVEIGTVRRIEENGNYKRPNLEKVAHALDADLDVIHANASARTITPSARRLLDQFEQLPVSEQPGAVELLTIYRGVDRAWKPWVRQAAEQAAKRVAPSASASSSEGNRDLAEIASDSRARARKSRLSR